MPSAREEILGRVRAALASKGAKRTGATLPDVHRTGERDFDASTFVTRARAAGAVVHELGADGAESEADTALGSRVLRVLDALGARSIAVSDAELAREACEGFDGDVHAAGVERDTLFACDAGVTCVQLAIAETGTLVLFTHVERHRLTSLVPEVHVALVARDTIVPTLDDALRAAAEQPTGPPRCVTFISGPSRTADIELELVVGVHGPRELHIVLY